MPSWLSSAETVFVCVVARVGRLGEVGRIRHPEEDRKGNRERQESAFSLFQPSTTRLLVFFFFGIPIGSLCGGELLSLDEIAMLVNLKRAQFILNSKKTFDYQRQTLRGTSMYPCESPWEII